MGKERKLRKKYRLLCSENNNSKSELESVKKNRLLKPDKSKISEIDAKSDKGIAWDKCSITKSIKSTSTWKSLSKVEKQRLRHDLFTKRIDAIYKDRNERSKRKREFSSDHSGRKKLRFNDSEPKLPTKTVDTEYLLSLKGTRSNEPRPEKNKQKLNTKMRMKTIVEDLDTFRKLLHNENYKKNPAQMITENIMNHLSKELLAAQNQPASTA